jgi:hypothetical protein
MVDSYDLAYYPQTGISTNGSYDLMCMWDVLEHIPNFEVIQDVLMRSKHVAISVPVKPDKVKLEEWKHFKPMEHLHYFSQESLISLFSKYGFRIVTAKTPECPPREDIISFIFRNEKLSKEG